jgi:hypothetical protein
MPPTNPTGKYGRMFKFYKVAMKSAQTYYENHMKTCKLADVSENIKQFRKESTTLDNNSNAEVVIVLDARKVNYMFPELHFRF